MIGEKSMEGEILQEVIKQTPFGYAYHKILFDKQGKAIDYIFIDVNNAFEKITGLERKKILGEKISKVLPNIRDDRFDWIEFYEEMIINGERREFTQYSEPLGRWYKVTAFSLEKGHFITLFQDVSYEMKQIEILEEQKKNFSKLSQELELIFNSTQDAMFLVSVKNGKFRYIRNNKAHQRLTGFELVQIKDKTPIELVGQEIGRIVEKNYQRCLEVGTTINYEETLELPGGEITWMTSLTPVCENGHIEYMVGSSKDITLQKRAEVERENYLKRLKAMYNSHSTVMLLIEPTSGRIVDANPAAISFYGYTKEEIRNLYTKDLNMLPKEEIKERRLEALRREKNYFQFPHRLKNGEIRLVDVNSCPIDVNGEEILFSIINDVSDREKYKEELFREKEFLRITLNSIGDGVITTDQFRRITSMNIVAEALTDWKEEEVKGKQFSKVLKIQNEDTGIEIEDPVSKVLHTNEIITPTNHIVLVHKNGKKVSISKTAAPIMDERGQTFGVVVILRDVTKEKEQQEKILYLSYHDSLTGLYNRRFMEEELRRLDNSRQLPMAIVMGDVNGLKITNDVFGHETGDKLLQKVAETIKENCRIEDIVARWGGDEFLILLPNTSEEVAKEIVHRIKNNCSANSESNLKLSISLGYAIKTRVEESLQKILNEAEKWMYHKKLLDGKSYRNAIIKTLMSTLYEKSTETEEHAERLKTNCYAVGKELKLSAKEIDELTLLAMLHDIGKVGIKESILKKPRSLTQNEWEEMKKHPEIGFRIVQNIPELSSVAELILYHHERWDGKGYPKGLSGNAIPLLSRILAVSDAYDAMISDRVYKKAISKEAALDELKRNAGTQFDSEVVDIFINLNM